MNQDDLDFINLLLDTLEKEKNACIFLEPVDHVGLKLHDYLTIITKPMDISTIRKQIEDEQYTNIEEIYKDIQLIWDNCKQYNIEGSEVYKMAQNCERFVKRFLDKHSKSQNGKNSNDKSKKNGSKGGANQKNGQNDNQSKEGAEMKEESRKDPAKGNEGPNENNYPRKDMGEIAIDENEEVNEPESSNGLSAYEKVTLSNRVKKLQNDGLASLVRLVQKDCPNSIKETNDIIEITLANLDRKTFEQIDRLINTFLRVKETNQENLEQKKNKVN